VIHDKLEIRTGDIDPLGAQPTGTDKQVFSEDKKKLKDLIEMQGRQEYMLHLDPHIRAYQPTLCYESMNLTVPDRKFVKALDRIQPLCFIIPKKCGVMEDDHIAFTLKYSGTYDRHFPELKPYYDNLINRLLQSIADKRGVAVDVLKAAYLFDPYK